jgi:hypothetical protein
MLGEVKNEILLHSVASTWRPADEHENRGKENARPELRLTGRFLKTN